MSHLVTSLVGRKIKEIYSEAQPGTIVAAYIDRGELTLIVENPEGGIHTRGGTGVFLEPINQPADEAEMTKEVLSTFKEPQEIES